MEDIIKKYILDKYNIKELKVEYKQDELSYFITVYDNRLTEFYFKYKWDYMIPKEQNLNIIEQILIAGIIGDFKI